MPLYLTTTQPEILLLRRRLKGLETTINQKNERVSQEERTKMSSYRGGWRIRYSPNLSQQSLRFAEAQRRVKLIQEFKLCRHVFEKSLPFYSWTDVITFGGTEDEVEPAAFHRFHRSKEASDLGIDNLGSRRMTSRSRRMTSGLHDKASNSSTILPVCSNSVSSRHMSYREEQEPRGREAYSNDDADSTLHLLHRERNQRKSYSETTAGQEKKKE